MTRFRWFDACLIRALIGLFGWAGYDFLKHQGARGDPGRIDQDEVKHLNRARGLAQQYQSANKQGKLDTPAVKAWAVKTGKGTATDFVSTRDGKDYILVPDVMGVTVIEAEGKGDRYVASMQGTGPKSDKDIAKIIRATYPLHRPPSTRHPLAQARHGGASNGRTRQRTQA